MVSASSPTRHTDLKQVKRQAKELLRSHREGSASSCEKLRVIPRLSHMSDREILNSDISLQEAQHALARDSGYASWADMKRQIAILAGETGSSAGASLRRLKPTINLRPFHPDLREKAGSRLMGLDVGSRTIKLARMSKTEEGHRLDDFGVIDIPHGAIEGGGIMKPEAVADSIRRLWERFGINEKDVITAIGGYKVIVKPIAMRKMSYPELTEVIRYETEQYIPFDLEDIELDFAVVGENHANAEMMDLVLVAAKKELVSTLVDLVRMAGLNPCIIDHELFAQQRILELSHTIGDKNVAVIDTGATSTYTGVWRRAAPVYSRDLDLGCDRIDHGIMSQVDCAQDEAEAIRIDGFSDSLPRGALQGIIRKATQDWKIEAGRNLDFYHTMHPRDRVEVIYLSGGGAQIEAYRTALSEKTDANVEIMDPLGNIVVNTERVSMENLKKISPQAATCLGLALRGAETA